jgi:hypothetical protein
LHYVKFQAGHISRDKLLFVPVRVIVSLVVEYTSTLVLGRDRGYFFKAAFAHLADKSREYLKL